MTDTITRLRIPPRARFDQSERSFDLHECFDPLSEESIPSDEAILHVIDGQLRLETDKESYELGPNQILLIDPDVCQEITATEPTELLVTYVSEEHGDT